ncbi:MAG: hypothetical protein WKF76_06095 [Nocardioidaceae bacterium]
MAAELLDEAFDVMLNRNFARSSTRTLVGSSAEPAHCQLTAIERGASSTSV